jgi:uncharacterized protein
MSLKQRLAARFSRSARLQYGVSLMESGDAKQGFALLSDVAAAGDPEAQYRVGRAYLDGTGVPPSLEEGARWLRLAAEAGRVDARFTLATLYTIGLPEGMEEGALSLSAKDAPPKRVPDFDKALHWARLAADAGSPDAQALLGYILTVGPEHLRDSTQARSWYEKSATAGCSQGHLGLGLTFLNEARDDAGLQRAAEQLRFATRGNLGTALYLLGVLNEQGRGMPRDLAAAADYYRRGAERGVPAAQSRYGYMLLEGRGVGRDISRAETWLRRAALSGETEAAALLGDVYARGGDLPPNYLEASNWYRFAADRGHGPAARALGLLYLTGAGVHRDPAEAARWFRISTEAGDQAGMADLGNLVLTGVGTDEERRTLSARFERAANDGDLVGAFNFGVCLAEGVGTVRDERQAAQWMHRAADGVVNAQYWYGRMLIEGRGVEPNVKAGCEWMEKAAEAGMTDAQVVLAQLMITGAAVGGRDHARALELYLAAAERGHVGAMFSAGAIYGGGHDVPEDRVKARAWFKRAAERGNGLAQLMYGRYLVRGLGGPANSVEGREWLVRAQGQGVKDAVAELQRLSGEDQVMRAS